MSCWKGGSEVRHEASNDSRSAVPQSRLPAAACRAQWPYERTATLPLPGLWRLVRRDRGHAALPAADPARGERARPAARHAAEAFARGRGGERAPILDALPVGPSGRTPCRGAPPGGRALLPTLPPGE